MIPCDASLFQDVRRKLMVELMRQAGFNIPLMPQGAFYVSADASRWTDDACKFAFEFLEKSGVGQIVAGIPDEGLIAPDHTPTALCGQVLPRTSPSGRPAGPPMALD